MKDILSISGSTRAQSSNAQLLEAIPPLFPDYRFNRYTDLAKLPLFQAELDKHPWPKEVLQWRTAVANTDALIIATPAYLFNLPAVLKNGLEWLSTSGELQQKPILAITLTPHPPRGEKAMQSLLWSLQALEARVVGQLPLYLSEMEEGALGAEIKEMLREAIQLL